MKLSKKNTLPKQYDYWCRREMGLHYDYAYVEKVNITKRDARQYKLDRYTTLFWFDDHIELHRTWSEFHIATTFMPSNLNELKRFVNCLYNLLKCDLISNSDFDKFKSDNCYGDNITYKFSQYDIDYPSTMINSCIQLDDEMYLNCDNIFDTTLHRYRLLFSLENIVDFSELIGKSIIDINNNHNHHQITLKLSDNVEYNIGYPLRKKFSVYKERYVNYNGKKVELVSSDILYLRSDLSKIQKDKIIKDVYLTNKDYIINELVSYDDNHKWFEGVDYLTINIVYDDNSTDCIILENTNTNNVGQKPRIKDVKLIKMRDLNNEK